MKKAIKEFFRVVLIAALPVVVINLELGALDLKVIGLAVLIAVLKAADKFVHEYGKDKNIKSLETGITRF